MSEYYRKLDAVAQTRYLEKLQLFGLEEKDDPYEASNSYFIDDLYDCLLRPCTYNSTDLRSV